LSVHGRGEIASLSRNLATALNTGAGVGIPAKVLTLTGTVQYDLWKNVISRLELRWDHALDGRNDFGGTKTPLPGGAVAGGNKHNAYEVIANIIYKF